MKLSIDDRRASMSVREFSEFGLGPKSGGPGRSGRWRTDLGNRWHRELQRRTEAVYANVSFEASITGVCLTGDWSLTLQGRIDQVVMESGTRRLREVKTVNADLPIDRSELEREYEDYFHQLAAYMHLARLQADWAEATVTGELVLVGIADGVIQAIPFGQEDDERFNRQLCRVGAFLDTRWEARRRLQKLAYHPPFEKPRPGQEYAGEAFARAANRSTTILFEAPTGYGKTGTVLDFAFARMRDGLFTRILYLTGKSTGQLPVMDQIAKMFTRRGGAYYYQMRNRLEHAIRSPLHTCEPGNGCRKGIEERWRQSGVSPPDLLENGTVSLEDIRNVGRKTGLCPYEISRSLLPFMDVWIGDYNYVFSPGSSGVFSAQPGFDPGTTLLIVDEAHNLPSRAASNYSYDYSDRDTEEVHSALRMANGPPSLVLAIERLHSFLLAVEPTDSLASSLEYELDELLSSALEHLGNCRLETGLLHPGAFERLWVIHDLKNFLTRPTNQPGRETGSSKLIWCPRKGALRFTCLDASSEIAAAMAPYGLKVLMSATLSPTDLLRKSCGLESVDCELLQAESPWREGAYRVAVDTRVDTRFRTREQHYRTTAETIAILAQPSRRPLAVFFPSYRYAQVVLEYVQLEHAHLSVSLQQRGLDLNAYERFIETGLRDADAIFLVLGSGFSEGIDTLGGRITRTLIVGPALPEVNAVQRALMDDRNHLPREEAFRQVYQVPAMIKINQALGRLVRAPGQRVEALLHCRRFQQSSYQELLAPEYRQFEVIANRGALERWSGTG